LPVSAGVFAVDGLGFCAPQFPLLCAWPSTKPTVKLALSFTLHGGPTTLNLGALGNGITPPADNPAASGGQR
jgi:hypothetical protein